MNANHDSSRSVEDWLRRVRAAVVLPLVLGILPLCVLANDLSATVQNARPSDESDPFPITLKMDPPLIFVTPKKSGTDNEKVRFHGRTLMMGPGSDRPVQITVDGQDPPSHTVLQASVDAKGDYSNSEFTPHAPGTYTIIATAPDGRGTASGKLIAVGMSALGQHADNVVKSAISTVAATLDVAEKKLDGQPASPAKARAEELIQNLRQAHRAYAETKPADTMRGFLAAAAKQHAPLGNRLPQLRGITASLTDLQVNTEQLQRMRSKLGSADVQCEAMAALVEIVKLTSTVISFEAKLAGQFASMSVNVLADMASNQAKSHGGAVGGLAASSLVTYGNKLGKDGKLFDRVKSANTVVIGLAGFMTEQVFDTYCKRFVGPVDGTFTGKFYRMVHGKRTMWWKQDYKISGRILLRYPRSAKGDHIQMTGRIEGYAHSFESWDDGMVAFDEKGITKGAIIAEAYVKPYDLIAETGAKAISQGKGILSAQVWGSIAGGALPNSFAMHVRGEYDGQSISVLIGKRITDFTAVTKAVNVVVSPLNTLGATVVWYPLPYVDGHSVLAGAFDDAPQRFNITTTKNIMTAKGKVNKIVQTEHARGEYHFAFKMCNPGC